VHHNLGMMIYNRHARELATRGRHPIVEVHCNGSGVSPLVVVQQDSMRPLREGVSRFNTQEITLWCFNIVLGRSRGQVINMTTPWKYTGQSTPRGKSRTYIPVAAACASGLHALHFTT
jgi:hypothetical protein